MLLGDLLLRVLICGNESPSRRLRALLHTWLGAYYALSLRGAALVTSTFIMDILHPGWRWWRPAFWELISA
jgi:hypothetical protein